MGSSLGSQLDKSFQQSMRKGGKNKGISSAGGLKMPRAFSSADAALEEVQQMTPPTFSGW